MSIRLGTKPRRPSGIHDVGANFTGDIILTIENAEHALVGKYIHPGAVVMEFGGRYGTTSCEIAKALENNGMLAVVEPDATVWYYLKRNLEVNNCKAKLVQGVLSKRNLVFATSSGGYATRTISGPDTSEQYGKAASTIITPVRSFTFSGVEKMLGSEINTLLIDCEGCIQHIFEEIKPAIDDGRIQTILLEADMPKNGGSMNISGSDCQVECYDYDAFFAYLQAANFRISEKNNDCDHISPGDWCGRWIWHYAFERIVL